MGMECLSVRYISSDRPPDETEKDLEELSKRREFLDFLIQKHPDQKPLISEARTCLESETAGGCLRKLLHGDKKVSEYNLGELSDSARYECLNLNKSASENRKENGDSYRYAEKLSHSLFHLVPTLSRSKTLEPEEARFLLDEMGHFIYQSFPPWRKKFSAHLQSIPSLRKTLANYPVSSPSKKSLTPRPCAEPEAFEKRSLVVPGLDYEIPVLHPKSDAIPWWLYDDLLQAGFETIQAFLTPQDMETLLRPGNGRPDFSLLLGISWRQRRDIFAKCGVEGDSKHGLYDANAHRVSLLPNHLLVVDNSRGTDGAPLSAIGAGEQETDGDTLLHEVGHALEAIFLKKEHQETVRALYLWTEDQYSHGRNLAPHPQHMVGGKPYALKNEQEFFAQMVSEYITQTVFGIPSKEPSVRARARVMSGFFSPGGIRPDAISHKAFEDAYRAEGMELSFGGNSLKIFARTGFQFAEIPNAGSRIVSNDWHLGLGIGYFHEGIPTGWTYGGALHLDLNPVGQGFEISATGEHRNKPTRIFDLGISGRIGYAFPMVRLALEPSLGYRHVQSSPESLHQFWLGGGAILFFGGVDLGFGASVRGSPQGGFSGNLSLQGEFSL